MSLIRYKICIFSGARRPLRRSCVLSWLHLPFAFPTLMAFSSLMPRVSPQQLPACSLLSLIICSSVLEYSLACQDLTLYTGTVSKWHFLKSRVPPCAFLTGRLPYSQAWKTLKGHSSFSTFLFWCVNSVSPGKFLKKHLASCFKILSSWWMSWVEVIIPISCFWGSVRSVSV